MQFRDTGFGVNGCGLGLQLGFRMLLFVLFTGLGFRVWALGFGFTGLGFTAWGLKFGGLGFTVWSLRTRDPQ